MRTTLTAFLSLSVGVLSVWSAPIPTVDLSGDAARHVIIAQGTETVYQGHPTTLLLPDGKTMFCVWTLNHGGPCGPMKRSDNGGLTWSELLPVPENWKTVRNCPALYRLTDPQGKTRLFVFAGQGPGGTRQPDNGTMQMSCSTDEGRTWTPMRSVNLECVMPFCAIVPIDGGKRLLGMTNIRRPGETMDKKSNIVTQSESTDGGLTWSQWRIVLDLGEQKPCEPELVRSPDEKQLLCLLRENKDRVALYMTTGDEGRTWSKAKPLPPGLFGDRHKAVYAKDGRLVVCFRDTGKNSPAKNHFVAWVGRYEDILAGRGGEYKIKLLHSHKGSDCGYPGLELLPDGTFVATTYVKYRPGPELNSVVSARFKLEETDMLVTAGEMLMPAPTAAKAQTITSTPRPAGIVMDDDAGEFTGDWVASAIKPALIGKTYRHDDNRGQGQKSVRFNPEIKEAGDYEVRLIYVATGNRATKVPVTIFSADGEKTVTVNQREDVLVNGVPRALGVFKFAAGRKGSVMISNTGTEGFVIVDAVQFVPVAIAKAERAGERDAGFPLTPTRSPMERETAANARENAAAVVVSPLAPKGIKPSPPKPVPAEPVRLAKDANPQDVDGKSYDLVVVGGTSAGVICAVRAAREGCSVLLVQHNRHIGGMMANGLMQWDALYGGHRAPLFTELLRNIERHYIATYGENSPDHQTIRYTHEHYPIGWAEPHVAEREFNRLVAGEKKITLLLGHYASAVERDGALLRSVTLREYGGPKEIRVRGATFADGTYEGDLFALAKVPYHCGREARGEYKEPHAGKVFSNIAGGSAPRDAVEGRLNIRPYGSHQGTIDPNSPFTADRAVQAYNYRFCVTKDPANRILLTAPPPGYNREECVRYNRKSIATNAGPNKKSHMNSPILPGENHDYPEADWPTREKIIQRHLYFALGLMWFLQNDESVPPKQREQFREWGLPKDEFADNHHVPYEMYVREARRILGRHVYSEHDNSLAPGLGRTPVHPDSIAITDWYMDSHACTTNSRPGFHYDGKLILTEESRPGQIPYRSLLPRGVDNLLVPACLSATHIAWGAVRLEPVWMQTGEAAGFAAALAKREKTTPAKLNSDLLVRTLVERRQMVSFFNDVSVAGNEPWIPAVQYFGTKGFFHDYDAKPTAPLKRTTAKVWADSLAKLRSGKLDPNALARAVAAAERADDAPVTGVEFVAMLPSVAKPPEGVFTRQHAIAMMWRVIK